MEENLRYMFVLVAGVITLMAVALYVATVILANRPAFGKRILDVRLGDYTEPSRVKKLLQGLNVAVFGNALRSFLSRQTFKLTRSEITRSLDVSLGVISVADLGFQDGAPSEKVFSALAKMGASFCPPETAIALLHQRGSEIRDILCSPLDAQAGLKLYMDPVDWCVFEVGYFPDTEESELWLGDTSAHPQRHWNSTDLFVFVPAGR